MHKKNKVMMSIIVIGILFLSHAIHAEGERPSSDHPPYNHHELTDIQQYILNNIATSNHVIVKKEKGHEMKSRPGAVIASPTRVNNHFKLDYQFHWIRDAAITMKEITQLYSKGSLDVQTQLQTYLQNYIHFEHYVQQQPSKNNIPILGQPKYNIDGSLWEGRWARPQNDGPALRAITMIAIANLVSQNPERKLVEKRELLDLIKTDLNYIVSQWQTANFDLWEEHKDSHHFFNKMVQRKALYDGATLLTQQFSDPELAQKYMDTAKKITLALLKHWNDERGYLTESVTQQNVKGGGLNSSIILGALYGDLEDVNDPFALNSDKMMSSVYFIRNIFSGLYKINLYHPSATFIGRYPSDVFDGNQFIYGNPWILTTSALAQYYYSLAKIYLKQRTINITQENYLFFRQLNLKLSRQNATIRAKENPEQFFTIINRLIKEGDCLLQGLKQYSVCYQDNTCHHFSEQLDRANGRQVGARDLTWSYVSLLSAMHVRAELESVAK